MKQIKNLLQKSKNKEHNAKFFERYMVSFKKMSKALDPICQEYNKKKVYFLWDAFCAYVRYGITPNEYITFEFYKLSSLQRKTYYTARSTKIEAYLNKKEDIHIFVNKHEFLTKFSNFIKRDWIYCKYASEEEIEDFIKKHKKVILKPINLSSGKGIHVYKEESVKELKEKEYLAETIIEQHEDMNKLNPSSVNTIRVFSLLDGYGIPHIFSAALRVGAKGAVVDNMHGGGVTYPIDTEHGVVMALGLDSYGNEYMFQPGSEVKVLGFEIPNWDKLKQFVCNAACVVPSVRLVAWDVAILPDSFEFIEANNDGNPDVMQAHQGHGFKKEIYKYI